MKLRTDVQLHSILLAVCLGLATAPSVASSGVADDRLASSPPAAFRDIPLAAIRHYALPITTTTALANERRSLATPSQSQWLQFDAEDKPILTLPMAGSQVELNYSQRHANGDITVSGTVTMDGLTYRLLLTQGKAGAIGELSGASTFLLLQQDNHLYMADMAAAGLIEPSYEHDVVRPTPISSVPAQRQTFAPTIQQVDGQAITVVDVMLLYATELTAVYPNGLADTLMTQLVAKANQAFVDSGVSMQLRLVRRQLVNYQQPSNFDALDDLRFALESNPSGNVDSSLTQVRSLRNQYGADIVAMIRTHDLNERGVCGVAYFPQSYGDILINISNVGISGGSNCGNTFTHEIGHNFGAGHQFVNGASVGARPTAGALIVNGKFNTVMSSIGTGDVNRNYSLNRFSNPDLDCAGIPCGDRAQADNASAIRFFAAMNAGLRPAVSTEGVNPPPMSNPDTDNDGVADLTDQFPFDPSEQSDRDNDGVGDKADRFPDNPAEQRDFDLDGIGDNSDPDDDNDGVLDINDALPFDPTDSVDQDGDRVGDKTDELALNFQEFRDSDKDGIGNRFDPDNDNDGVPDFDQRSTGAQQLLVVNAGSGQIIALNPVDGRKIDTLYQAPVGSFSFRSDLVSLSPGQLAFVQASDIVRLDRQSKTSDVFLRRAAITTAFSVALLKMGDTQAQSRLWVTNGLGASSIEYFDFSNSAMQGSSNKLRTENVWRDLLALNGNILVVERDTNQIMSINPTQSPLRSTVWASGTGLNKPEQLALMPDGSVLVTNAGSRNVSRFNGNGQYQGEFISAGSAGLGMPGCIAVDHSGNVYVCSTNTNKILKYGSNGAPISELASAESVGLNQPVTLLLTGAVLDTAPFDPNNDTDGDGVANRLDAFPLDASRSAVQPPAPPPVVPPVSNNKSGGPAGWFSLLGLAMIAWRRRMF